MMSSSRRPGGHPGGGPSPVGDPASALLSAARLGDALRGYGSMWRDIRVLDETGSTNEDVLAQAQAGAAEGMVIAAQAQLAGRGRQGRAWHSAPGGALTFSVLLRPGSVPQPVRGWVPLLAGVAVATALRTVTGVDARLKWPNDVLVGAGKLAGILAEQAGDAIVVGVGINVLGHEHDLPVATATSLECHGAGGTDRTVLLTEILAQLEYWYQRWRGNGLGSGSGDGDASGLRPEYLRRCATIGTDVRVELPGGGLLTGRATGVDGAGRLLVRAAGGDSVAVSAGDVIHVR